MSEFARQGDVAAATLLAAAANVSSPTLSVGAGPSTGGADDDGVAGASSVKKPWSTQEDEQLAKAVAQIGPYKWPLIALRLPGRAGKQCRERWFNHLCPSVRKGSWTPEEDKIIFDGVAEMGKKWSEIVKRLPGRTDNSIKNRYNSHKRREARRERAAQTADVQMGSPGAVTMAVDLAIRAAKRVHGEHAGGEGKKRQLTSETTIVLSASAVLNDEQTDGEEGDAEAGGVTVAEAVVATFTPPLAPFANYNTTDVPECLLSQAQPLVPALD